MPAAIVGRDRELASIREFVASVSDGASAFVLEGEAGVGKTTLWRAAVAEAEESGLRVLKALPAESESSLSFSAIGDLLDPAIEEALAVLPAPQRRALARALMLEDDHGPIPDAHAIGVAVLHGLRALAGRAPLVVAVDDVQWLDPASAGALAYGARRLGDERVGLLLARRVPLESSVLSELKRSLPANRLTTVEVAALDVGALHHVVRDSLGIALPRPLLAEVHHASGGNPFFALEIVRTLQRTGAAPEAGQPLPVPESLHELVHGRLSALPPASRDYLLAAAAHPQPMKEVVEEASGVGSDEGLTPALEAGIVALDGARIRFAHPLLAAGAYETADSIRRREIHERLAELLDDPEARAWQLAASVDEQNEDVARALEHAAQHARARGGLRPAALLLDRAHELTPVARRDDALRRAADAAFLHFESGDSPRAESQLRAVIDSLAPSEQRAKALWVLARVRTYEAPGDAVELFLRLLDEAEDPELLAAAHEGVASSLLWLLERFPEQIEHAEGTLAFALERGDDALAGDAFVSKLLAEAWLGQPNTGATATTALAFQGSSAGRRLLDQPLIALVQHWLWIDQPDRAREALIELVQRVEDLGDESSRPYVLSLLGQVEYMLGNFDRALACAREGQDAASQSGQPLFVSYHLALESLVEGSPERAREAVARACALIPGTGGEGGLLGVSALGHLELALGHAAEAAASLKPVIEAALREGIAEPSAVRLVVDQIEALTELGRGDEAVELLDWYEGNAQRLERISALANCARCRGMLAAQAGELEEALAAYAKALEWHEQVEFPLDRGRTLLALGVAQRRAKRRSEARETLGEALSVFERIGAALWAERARAELRRISGRAATPGSLTPAEERVAALVAEGKTNREVGAALFLSDRTVEGHLSRIFGKLGVRSRTELARILASRSGQGIESSNTGDSPVSRASAPP